MISLHSFGTSWVFTLCAAVLTLSFWERAGVRENRLNAILY